LKSAKWGEWLGRRDVKLLTISVLSAVLFISVVGLAGYLSMVVPSNKELLETKALGLAQGIDEIVKLRSTSVSMAAQILDLEHLASEGGGNRVVNALKDRFPDFMSLEILDENGEILAMFGDLSLPDAGRKSGAEDVPVLDSGQGSSSESFQDNPQGGCFFITTKRTQADGKTWLTRTRFAREPIEAILASVGGNWSAELRPVGQPGVTAPSGWRNRTVSAEVQLPASGWTIKLAAKPTRPFPSGRLIFAFGVILLLLGTAYLAIRYIVIVRKGSARHAEVQRAGRMPAASIQPPPGENQSVLEPTHYEALDAVTPVEHDNARLIVWPPSSITTDQDTFQEEPECACVETSEEPHSSDILPDVGHVDAVDILASDSAPDAIPEFMDVSWVEPGLERDLPKKVEKECDCPSAFAGI
jgi:hypothetical protein